MRYSFSERYGYGREASREASGEGYTEGSGPEEYGLAEMGGYEPYRGMGPGGADYWPSVTTWPPSETYGTRETYGTFGAEGYGSEEYGAEEYGEGEPHTRYGYGTGEYGPGEYRVREYETYYGEKYRPARIGPEAYRPYRSGEWESPRYGAVSGEMGYRSEPWGYGSREPYTGYTYGTEDYGHVRESGTGKLPLERWPERHAGVLHREEAYEPEEYGPEEYGVTYGEYSAEGYPGYRVARRGREPYETFGTGTRYGYGTGRYEISRETPRAETSETYTYSRPYYGGAITAEEIPRYRPPGTWGLGSYGESEYYGASGLRSGERPGEERTRYAESGYGSYRPPTQGEYYGSEEYGHIRESETGELQTERWPERHGGALHTGYSEGYGERYDGGWRERLGLGRRETYASTRGYGTGSYGTEGYGYRGLGRTGAYVRYLETEAEKGGPFHRAAISAEDTIGIVPSSGFRRYEEPRGTRRDYRTGRYERFYAPERRVGLGTETYGEQPYRAEAYGTEAYGHSGYSGRALEGASGYRPTGMQGTERYGERESYIEPEYYVSEIYGNEGYGVREYGREGYGREEYGGEEYSPGYERHEEEVEWAPESERRLGMYGRMYGGMGRGSEGSTGRHGSLGESGPRSRRRDW